VWWALDQGKGARRMFIVIVGARGMLGRELVRLLEPQHEVVAWDIQEIDITDRPRTIEQVASLRPDLVLNSAAWPDVDGCEREPDKAWLVNAVGAQNLALAARQAGSALLYMSTDYVFNGRTPADYDETAPVDPINHYGRSKLAGEAMSTQICSATYVVRSAWLIGDHPNNYVDRVLASARRDGVVRMAQDQIESPTTTTDLGQAIAALITTGAYGCYHVTSQGACTRAAFAEFVLREAGRPERVEIVDAGTLPRLAARPHRTVLDCRLFRLVTGQALPAWQDGLRAFMASRSIGPSGAAR
jgi:dTDP-4-dehydrorhamnose reductase